MDAYLEHPSRVSRWQDGELVVLHDAALEDCTVWFAFDRTDGGETRWEGVLGRRLAPDRARLCGIPLFVDGVHLGDAVSLVESAEGAPVAVEVVAAAGNTTFRVLLEPAAGAGEDDRRWRELMAALEPFGCWFDMYGPERLAVSVEGPRADAVAIRLEELQGSGELRYERV